MANLISGKTWILDSAAGIVSMNPVCIHSIIVNWASATAGVVSLSAYQAAGSSFADVILYATTVTAGTTGGACVQLSQQFQMGNQTFNGLTKVTCTGLQATAIMIITGVPN